MSKKAEKGPAILLSSDRITFVLMESGGTLWPCNHLDTGVGVGERNFVCVAVWTCRSLCLQIYQRGHNAKWTLTSRPHISRLIQKLMDIKQFTPEASIPANRWTDA